MARRTLSLYLLAVCLLCALVIGCNDEQLDRLRSGSKQAEATAEQVAGAMDVVIAEKATVDAAIVNLPPSEQRDKAIALSKSLGDKITVGRQWLDKAQATLATFNALLANAEDGFDAASATLTAAGPLLPQPWGALIAGAGGLMIGLVRAGYNRHLGRKIVRSLDTAGATRLTAKEILTINVAQGPTGRRLVDEAQGKKFALPF